MRVVKVSLGGHYHYKPKYITYLLNIKYGDVLNTKIDISQVRSFNADKIKAAKPLYVAIIKHESGQSFTRRLLSLQA